MSRLLLIIFVGLSCSAYTQSIGVLPAGTCSYKLDNGWKLISKLEQRTKQDAEFNSFRHDLIDCALFSSKQVDVNKVWNSGIQLRFKAGEIIPRFIQQLVIKESYFDLDCSHRIVWDITKKDSDVYSNRFRYRFAGVIPFQGEQVDERELYGKWGIEALNQIEAAAYTFEHRSSFYAGLKLSSSFKVEIGPEWRFKIKFEDAGSTRNFWMRMNFYNSF